MCTPFAAIDLRSGHPAGQRRVGQRPAGIDVLRHPGRDVGPARGLPCFERTHLPPEAPADRQVDVARVVGDIAQVVRAVVKQVAEDCPQELRLRVRRCAQLREFFGGRADLQQLGDFGGDLAGGGAVVARRRIEHLDFLADFAEEPCFGLGAQRALRYQSGQHRRRSEQRVPRIVRQRVEHRLHDVRHRVQADDIGRAIGGAFRAADRRTGQCVHHVEAEPEGLGMLHRRQHREDADAVGDEIGRVLRADHAFAQRGGQECLERIQQSGVGFRRSNDFDQVHVPGRIEEMDAAKARPKRRGNRRRQRRQRKAGRIGRKHGVRRNVLRDFLVEIALPVETLRDGLDDQVAIGEARQIAAVIRGVDRRCAILDAQRRGFELGESGDRLGHEAIRVAFLRGEVEQHDGDAGVGKVRGNLRAHDAGAEDGGLADDQR